MKLADILLSEITYTPYRVMVQVISKDASPSVVADLIRALPGVTTCTIAGSDDARKTYTFKVKLITQKPPSEALKALKNNAMSKYSEVNAFKIAPKSVERMRRPGEY
tara:strand:+ start:479 stop:799 length:321 start_codon:yes stop_codon:yes gene_type:complete